MVFTEVDHFEMGRARHEELLRDSEVWRMAGRYRSANLRFNRLVFRLGSLLISLGHHLQNEHRHYAARC
jgi:hypothetical protein